MVELLANKYRFENVIGKGSFSRVIRGVNLITNEKVAIKHIDIRHLKHNKGCEYALQEIKVMKQLNHPNIIYLHESIIVDLNIWMVFEYCSEGDLSMYLKKMPDGKISEIEARNFTSQLINGMNYLYQNKIIHRDIKPPNILLHKTDDKLWVKLADFGFAKELKDIDEMSKSICGTPLYMAPEILQGESYSIKADLWSLGLIIFEMITGKYPFKAEGLVSLIKETRKDLIISSQIQGILSPNCLEIIKGLIERDYNKRLSMIELCKHPWFADSEIDISLFPDIMKEIDDFCIVEADIPNKFSIAKYTIYDDWTPIK